MSLWTLLKFDGHFFVFFDCDGCLSEVNKLIKRQKYEEKNMKEHRRHFYQQQKNVFL